MDLRAAYDTVMELEKALQADLMLEAEREMTFDPKYRGGPDYRTVKALGAAYELQDYLANRIAEAVNSGELEPYPDE